MEFILFVVAYVGIGHLIATLVLSRSTAQDTSSYKLILWTIWPLVLLLTLGDHLRSSARKRMSTRREQRSAGLADPDRISELERELGMNTSDSTHAISPAQFSTLPGTQADACLLPAYTANDFRDRYGVVPFPENAPNLQALAASVAELSEVTHQFAQQAQSLDGQPLHDAAEAALRRISRIEQG